MAPEFKKKTIYQLDTPFTTVQWPSISEADQTVITDLLCATISPIGGYRTEYIVPSKGKRSKKRRRQETNATQSAVADKNDRPPPPEIFSYVVVGLNNITRRLETLSKNGRATISPTPEKLSRSIAKLEDRSAPRMLEVKETNDSTNRPFAAIFVSRSTQPAILHAHLPQLIAACASANPEFPKTKLVQLPKGSDSRLCVALGLQRVSFIGVLPDAPHSKALMDFVQTIVPEVVVPWLEESQHANYLPVKVNAIQTVHQLSTKKPKQS